MKRIITRLILLSIIIGVIIGAFLFFKNNKDTLKIGFYSLVSYEEDGKVYTPSEYRTKSRKVLYINVYEDYVAIKTITLEEEKDKKEKILVSRHLYDDSYFYKKIDGERKNKYSYEFYSDSNKLIVTELESNGKFTFVLKELEKQELPVE